MLGSANDAPHTDGFLSGGRRHAEQRPLLIVCLPGRGVGGPGFVLRGADVLTAALALAITSQQPVPLLHPKGP